MVSKKRLYFVSLFLLGNFLLVSRQNFSYKFRSIRSIRPRAFAYAKAQPANNSISAPPPAYGTLNLTKTRKFSLIRAKNGGVSNIRRKRKIKKTKSGNLKIRETSSGSLIVKFKKSAYKKKRIYKISKEKKYKQFGMSMHPLINSARLKREHDKFGLRRIYIVNSKNNKKLLDILRKDNRFEYVEEDKWRRPQFVPNDEYFNEQWSLLNSGAGSAKPDADIDMDLAWDIQKGSGGISVGVIDTGVDVNHSDLASNIWHNPGETPGNGIDDDANGYVDDVIGWNFYEGNNNVEDDSGHGTHVSGVISAVTNNNSGISGICGGDFTDGTAGCKIIALKACKKFAVGGVRCSVSGIVSAIEYAVDPDADPSTDDGVSVINMSLGGSDFSRAERDAVDYAYSHGVLLVSSAGNENSTLPTYPAFLENVIGVAMTNNQDVKSLGSNYGNWISISAPGEGIKSTYLNGSYYTLTGTSMAAPHVAGVAALLKLEKPFLSNKNLTDIIESSADDIEPENPNYLGYIGAGRLNASNALNDVTALTGNILWPVEYGKYNGSLIQIEGSAYAYFVDSHDIRSQDVEWYLEYGAGSNPTSWSDTYIHYVKDRNKPADTEVLAEIDLSKLDNGVTTIRLTVVNTKNTETVRKFYRRIVIDKGSDIIIQAGWPIEFDDRYLEFSFSPLISNLYPYAVENPRAVSANLIAGFGNTVHIYDRSGKDTAAWPIIFNESITGAPAVADITPGNSHDLAIFFTANSGKVYGFDRNGQALPGWSNPKDTSSMWSNAPVIADIDKDGSFEIIVGYFGGITAFESNGNLKWNSEVDGDILHSTVSVADLDKDGFDEIIAGTDNGKIYMIQHDGSLSQISQVNGGVFGAPIIADLEQNHRNLEIIIPSFDSNGNGFLTILDASGTLQAEFSLNSKVYSPAVGDIDSDGKLEIVSGDFGGNLYVFNDDLSGGFVANLGSPIKTQPVLADVAGDANVDIIVVTEDGKLHIINKSGEYQIDGAYQLGSGTARSEHAAPSVGDFDGDGDIEISVSLLGSPSSLNVLDMKKNYDPARSDMFEWWTYHGNQRRTGCYKKDCVVRGDSNNDGKVTSWDAYLVSAHLNGDFYMTPDGLENAMQAADPMDELTTDDRMAILRCSVNGGNPYNCW